MLSALDILLTTLAIIVMAAGLRKRLRACRMGQGEERCGDWRGLLRYLLGHRKILEDRLTGIPHLFLFWGVVIPVLLVILAQFGLTGPRPVARILSFLGEMVGFLMLLGTLFFLGRRIAFTRGQAPEGSLFPLIILLVILLTGFVAEGARLSIVHAGFSWSYPVGWVLSNGLPGSPLLMQLMIRFHFFSVLFLIAMLPFTSMRHLVFSPINIYYRKRGPRGDTRPVDLQNGPLGAGRLEEFTWKQLMDAEACVSCGRCEKNCPAAISGKPLSPRKVMRDILKQMEAGDDFSLPVVEDAVTTDEIWACTTCMACVETCPVYIEPMDKIIDMRRYLVLRQGQLPSEARPMIRNLEIFGDVQGKGAAHRGDWAFDRDVPLVSEAPDSEVLLWVGCSGAFHPGYQEVPRALTRILREGGVGFGMLSKEELCCGDPARRMGDEALFLDLAKKNIARFRQYGIQKIVTLCPHCFNTLKNEYPSLGAEIEVVHGTQFVIDLIHEGRIRPRFPLNKTITVHDPCYLARINDISLPLREIIASIDGLALKELDHSDRKTSCCGGGGGRMWLHERLGRRINQIRAKEITQAGVDLVATACPYCLTMLDDGLKSLDLEGPPRVKDIIEMVAFSLG